MTEGGSVLSLSGGRWRVKDIKGPFRYRGMSHLIWNVGVWGQVINKMGWGVSSPTSQKDMGCEENAIHCVLL